MKAATHPGGPYPPPKWKSADYVGLFRLMRLGGAADVRRRARATKCFFNGGMDESCKAKQASLLNKLLSFNSGQRQQPPQPQQRHDR